MGNRMACGLKEGKQRRGFEDSPYSKTISKNLVRFWAEVFLMAQEGFYGELKWQKVVPKLVPVNLARVQDAPIVVSHVTAYNTKVDKVMDVLICVPDVQLRRQADCFVYWDDHQKGLTWGLNFITPEDATHFLNLANGIKKGVLCRRANSTASLAGKKSSEQWKRSNNSIPNTPDPSQRRPCQRHSVKFADQAVCIPPDAPMVRPISFSQPSTPSRRDPAVAALNMTMIIPSPQLLEMTGRKLSDWDTIIPPSDDESSPEKSSMPACLHADANVGLYDNLLQLPLPLKPTLNNNVHAICPEKRLSDVTEESGVWERLTPQPNEEEPIEQNLLINSLSLDSHTLKRMLDPLPHREHSSSRERSPASLALPAARRFESFKGPVPSPALTISPAPISEASVIERRRDSSSASTSGAHCAVRDHHRHGSRQDAASSTSLSSMDSAALRSSSKDTKQSSGKESFGAPLQLSSISQANLVADGATRVSSLSTMTKRSSLHLIAGENGRFQSVGGSALHRRSSNSKEKEDSTSISSHSSESPKSSSQDQNATAFKFQNSKARKAGPLLMKAWLVPCMLPDGSTAIQVLQQELWQQYWAYVRGSSLQLQIMSEPTVALLQSAVRKSEDMFALDLSNCLVQPVPEYPRRQHVFCISTHSGHAFLLQASSDQEVESWMQSLHVASALALSRANSREVAARYLRKELDKTDHRIETVSKMLRISQLPAVGAVSTHQVEHWETELEALNLQHYTYKCYLAALKGVEGPTCKKLLAAATQHTKTYLSQLGAFTASTVHSLVFAVENTRPLERNASAGQTTTLIHDKIPEGAEERASPACTSALVPTALATLTSGLVLASSPTGTAGAAAAAAAATDLVQVNMPSHQVAVVSVSEADSVVAVLRRACEQCNVEPERYFVVLRRDVNFAEVLIPEDNEALQSKAEGFQIEIREKLVYHVHLERPHGSHVFGLTIRAQRDAQRQGLINVLITAIDTDGVAKQKGLAVGDELLAINKHTIRRLTPAAIEELLQQSTVLCLVLRTKRLALPVWLESLNHLGSQESLSLISCSGSSEAGEENEQPWLGTQPAAASVIKYRPGKGMPSESKQRFSLPIIHGDQIPPQNFDEEPLSANPSPYHRYENRYSLALERPSVSEPLISATDANNGKTLDPSERLEKLLFELLETERSYVQDLETLAKQYLEPLQERQLQPVREIAALLQATVELIRFQRQFVEDLKDAAGPEFLRDRKFSSPSQLRLALMKIGYTFVNHSRAFKTYAPFCVAHVDVQKSRLTLPEQPATELARFLKSQNLHQQHSGSFESYFIKPVQRVLRYPLFLSSMKEATINPSPEHSQISTALEKMQYMASYINDMQRVHEEHGLIFGQLQKHCQNQLVNLSLTLLIMCGDVLWLNPGEDTNSKRKSSGHLECKCYVFQSAVVLVGTKKQPNKRKASLESQTIPRLIPISEMEINSIDQGLVEEVHFWTLVHLSHNGQPERVYRLANREFDLKHKFLKAILKAGQQPHGVGRMKSPQLNGVVKSAPTTKTAAVGVATTNGGSSGTLSCRTSTHGDQDDNACMSSPDSGFPAPYVETAEPNHNIAYANGPLTDSRNVTKAASINGSANGHVPGAGLGPAHTQCSVRPGSFHSSQSDAGYGSNSEMMSAGIAGFKQPASFSPRKL